MQNDDHGYGNDDQGHGGSMMTLTIATTTDRTKTTCATPDTPTQDDHNYYGIGDGNDNQRQGPCVESMNHHETTTENSDKDMARN